jgi:lysophospholipase L1-like esterase
MVEAVRAAGGTVQYCELEGIGHDAWVKAYELGGALDWMFERRLDPSDDLAAAQERLGEACAPRERIAFLGDSITEAGNQAGGYVDTLRVALGRQRPEAVVLPAGISGHKVPDLLKRFRDDVIEPGATLVFLYIGINDVWHSEWDKGTPAPEFEAGLRTLIRDLRASGAEVVLATPSVIGERPWGENRLDTMLADYAAISRRVAAEERATLCDLQQAFRDHLRIFNPQDLEKGVLTTDGVHLNAAGNRLVALEAARSLRSAARARAARQ